jgi:hypothetical protein
MCTTVAQLAGSPTQKTAATPPGIFTAHNPAQTVPRPLTAEGALSPVLIDTCYRIKVGTCLMFYISPLPHPFSPSLTKIKVSDLSHSQAFKPITLRTTGTKKEGTPREGEFPQVEKSLRSVCPGVGGEGEGRRRAWASQILGTGLEPKVGCPGYSPPRRPLCAEQTR